MSKFFPKTPNRTKESWKHQQRQIQDQNRAIGKHQSDLEKKAIEFWSKIQLEMNPEQFQQVERIASAGSVDQLDAADKEQFSQWVTGFKRQLPRSGATIGSGSSVLSMTLFAVIIASLARGVGGQTMFPTQSPTFDVVTPSFSPTSFNDTNSTLPVDSAPIYEKPLVTGPVVGVGAFAIAGLATAAGIKLSNSRKEKKGQEEIQGFLASDKDAQIELLRKLAKAVRLDSKGIIRDLEVSNNPTLHASAQILSTYLFQQCTHPNLKKGSQYGSALNKANDLASSLKVDERIEKGESPYKGAHLVDVNLGEEVKKVRNKSAILLQDLCEDLVKNCKDHNVKTMAQTILKFNEPAAKEVGSREGASSPSRAEGIPSPQKGAEALGRTRTPLDLKREGSVEIEIESLSSQSLPPPGPKERKSVEELFIGVFEEESEFIDPVSPSQKGAQGNKPFPLPPKPPLKPFAPRTSVSGSPKAEQLDSRSKDLDRG